MKTRVRFENVSKKYRLGLTRVSLPSKITEWMKIGFNGFSNNSKKEKFIWALRDINFELKEGQCLALIGPNGAGKSTILKLLANITRPSSGKIETKGQLSALIELGAGFHPELTARENIYLNGVMLGLSREYIRKNFDEIVSFSELEDFLDTPIKRFSSGMNVRLGFAVAASIEPEILLVDEVLAVGDTSFRQKCMYRIQELIDKGTSIIFVSHNLWLVQAICVSAIYIEKGQVIYYGDTSTAIEHYDRSISEQRIQKIDKSSTGNTISRDTIEITKIEILRAGTQEIEELSNDEKAEIRVSYFSYRNLGNLNFVIRIIRSDGLTCCMMRSRLDNVPLTIEHGKGIVAVILDPLQLRGGSYYVDVAIRDAGDSRRITRNNSDWFFVKGSILTSNEMNGVFEPKRKWIYQPIH